MLPFACMQFSFFYELGQFKPAKVTIHMLKGLADEGPFPVLPV